jgi:hypothetical protein
MHNFGLAFDVVPLDAGKPVWNVSDQQFSFLKNSLVGAAFQSRKVVARCYTHTSF